MLNIFTHQWEKSMISRSACRMTPWFKDKPLSWDVYHHHWSAFRNDFTRPLAGEEKHIWAFPEARCLRQIPQFSGGFSEGNHETTFPLLLVNLSLNWRKLTRRAVSDLCRGEMQFRAPVGLWGLMGEGKRGLTSCSTWRIRLLNLNLFMKKRWWQWFIFISNIWL